MKKKELRDEIAIAAMASLILQTGETVKMHVPEGTLELPRREGIPKIAYMYADEMMKVRDA